ncbi:hypothetical protein CHS0354_000708 [Potamilus streckersoni]|uniref:Uncharacterized protein n=1 Tax=Potamilus streckersoni TaxID=2493646 RepID=A0AAE0W965_9BIVA|nr:hypothetical protein CHS0354_000708 [Potamilus streckersoni]
MSDKELREYVASIAVVVKETALLLQESEKDRKKERKKNEEDRKKSSEKFEEELRKSREEFNERLKKEEEERKKNEAERKKRNEEFEERLKKEEEARVKRNEEFEERLKKEEEERKKNEAERKKRNEEFEERLKKEEEARVKRNEEFEERLRKEEEERKKNEAERKKNEAERKKRNEEFEERLKKRDEALSEKIESLWVQIRKTESMMNRFGFNVGSGVEEYFYNTLKSRMSVANIQFEYCERNLKGRNESGEDDEFDIVLKNGTKGVLVECKHRVRKEDVSRMQERKINNFRQSFPGDAKLEMYIALAGISFEPKAEEEAKRAGMILLKQVGERLIEEADNVKVY